MNRKIQYELTEDDYLAFNLYHLRHDKRVKKQMILARVVPPTAYLLLGAVLCVTFAKGAVMTGIIIALFTAACLLWFFFFPRYWMNRIRLTILGMIRTGQIPTILGHHKLTLTDEGLLDTATDVSTPAPYKALTKIGLDESATYLFDGPLSAYIIPNTAFGNDAEKTAFLGALHAYLTPDVPVVGADGEACVLG